METPWYQSWFNSPYYSILYNHRDEREAEIFVKAFCQHWREYKPPLKVLDLGCGAGRFAYQFARHDYEVLGIDLSDYLLSMATKRYPHPKLTFQKGDMRTFQLPTRFHIIGSFFTSFGYFQNVEENSKVLSNIKQHLMPKGLFILDYFNLHFVCNHLVPEEKIEKAGIVFHIQRKMEGKQLLKIIEVEGQTYREEVYAFSPDELIQLLESQEFHIREKWGDYDGKPFSKEESPRLILFVTAED